MSDVLQRRGRQSRRRGADAERAVRDLYRTGGWQAFRVSDSAVADVVAIRVREVQHEQGPWIEEGAEVLFIEVKRTVAPYAHFSRDERELLKLTAKGAGAAAILFWWPKGKAIGEAQIIESKDWP